MEDIAYMFPQSQSASVKSDPASRSPTHEWTSGIPSPPHLIVPPLPMEHEQNWNLIPSPYSEFQAGDYARVNMSDLQVFHSALDWRYELRRQAQAVLPFLYLGPFNAARDRAWLRNVGVTMLLHIREASSAATQPRFFDCSAIAHDLGITSLTLDVVGHAGLMACFPTAINAINRHMSASQRPVLSAFSAFGDAEATGKVLVFCESGNEKSAAVVVAYLMAVYDLTVVQALQLIQIQRFSVSVDDSMKHMLLSFSSILQAKRDVVRAKTEENISSAAFGMTAVGNLGPTGVTSEPLRFGLNGRTALGLGNGNGKLIGGAKNKRTVDDFYDGEDAQMDSSDSDITGRRPGAAPFKG